MAYTYYSHPAQPVPSPLSAQQPLPRPPAQSPAGPPLPYYTPQQHAYPLPQAYVHPQYFPQPLAGPSSQPLHFSHLPQLPPQPPARPMHSYAPSPSRSASRPLPQAPMMHHPAQDTPPPPVPESSRPASYASARQAADRAPVTTRPLPEPLRHPPRPVEAAPTPPTTPARQPRRSPKPASPPTVAVVPSIAVDQDPEERDPGMPSFSFSGPDEDEQPPASAAATPQKQPAFSVSVAPPSPPKTVAESTPPRVNELGQSQRGQAASSDSVTTRSLSQEMVCAGCNLPIGGRIVSAMKRKWHPDCFKCDACGEGLEHVAFYEAEGKPFCHVDYHERFSIRCHHCKTPIESETYVTLDDPALGHRYYHELHFFCSQCGDPFIDPKSLNRPTDQQADSAAVLAKPFVVHDGWPYCESCNVKMHKPKCAGCKQPIQDEQVLSAMNKSWHEDCFVCASCEQPFEESFMLRQGMPYCEPCYRVALRSDV